MRAAENAVERIFPKFPPTGRSTKQAAVTFSECLPQGDTYPCGELAVADIAKTKSSEP